MFRTFRSWLVYFALLACTPALALEPPDLSAFLDDDGVQKRLRAGEMVVSGKDPKGKRIYFDDVFEGDRIKRRGGILFLFVVDLPLDEVWDVLQDAELHPEIFPNLKTSRRQIL